MPALQYQHRNGEIAADMRAGSPEPRASALQKDGQIRLPAPARQGQYRCIVIDPPWDQGKTGRRAVRPNQGVALDYPTLTQDEILTTAPLQEWAAANAFLWLWATNSRSRSSGRPILQQAFDLMNAWGFRYYTMLTWDKKTGPCPFGPYQITTEHCLFGYRGKCEFTKTSLGKMKTCFDARATRHSEKPAGFYRDIKDNFPAPRLDVFSRRPHQGFDGWGLEAGTGGADKNRNASSSGQMLFDK